MLTADRRRLALTITLVAVAFLSYAFLMTFRGGGDIRLYHRYAVAFWSGASSFRQLPNEYPPLSILVFSLTLVPPLGAYVLVFGAWMVVTFMGLLVVLQRTAGVRTAAVAASYLLVGAFATIFARYDLVPALASVVALVLSLRGRYRLAYLLLAGGILLKLYPVIFIPLVAANQFRLGASWSRLVKDLAGAVGLVAGGFALAALLSPSGWTGAFSYAQRRPLEVDSIPASIAWIASAFGIPLTPNHSFHSYNVMTPLAGALTAAGALVLGAAIVWLTREVRRGRLELYTAAAAAIVLAILTGKVFSPQYLIWALPLVALAQRRVRPLWLAVGGLTTLIFPVLYDAAGLVGLSTPQHYPVYFLGAIALRNLLLALGGVALLVGAERQQSPAGWDKEPITGGRGGDEVLGDRDLCFGHGVSRTSVEAP